MDPLMQSTQMLGSWDFGCSNSCYFIFSCISHSFASVLIPSICAENSPKFSSVVITCLTVNGFVSKS